MGQSKTTFSGKKLNRKEPLFFQYGSWQVLRQNQWKLVRQIKKPWQLYDLSKDRTETRDLATNESERSKQMTETWEKWANELGINPVPEKKKKNK